MNHDDLTRTIAAAVEGERAEIAAMLDRKADAAQHTADAHPSASVASAAAARAEAYRAAARAVRARGGVTKP